MTRQAIVSRETKETKIHLEFGLDGTGFVDISTGIPFFDHMLTSFSVHGFFDLVMKAHGDIEVDLHHTVEDVGLVLGQALLKNLDQDRKIFRFGDASVPMDEALSQVNVDLSNRPYLIYNVPDNLKVRGNFDAFLAKEFFQAFCMAGRFNLHINVDYGANEHHVLESIFKAMGRSLHKATRLDHRLQNVLSSKGCL